ncbi:MAG TPA: type VII secretion integral membrane protein EccD [Streptosporangiaceae bacterium]|nr:type VII secretion integral membrane protein EccD [Streptosporangiaceae bacterium]
MSSAGGTDLCRITVVGPSRRVDIALPGYVPFADLFPAVARYAGLDGPDVVGERGGWVLQRLGQEPFSPAMTPIQAGLRDGEMIYLRPQRSQLPQLAFDDVADVIATRLNEQPGRWAPRDIRWVALGAGAAALTAGAVFILRSGPPWLVPAVTAAAVAVALLIAVAAVSRAAGDSRAGAVLGFTAIPYAFLAGLLAPARSTPLVHLGAVHLLSALAAATLAAVLAAAASGEVSLFFGAACAGLLGVIASWVGYGFGIGYDGAAAVIVVPTLALTPLIPAVSFRMARMTLPQVPRHADDLRRDTLPVDGAEVFDRTTTADRFVTGAASGIGLVAAAAELGLAFARSWLGLVTCAVLACALLLRSRLFRGLAQRLWLLVPGYGALILLAAGAVHGPTQAQHLARALGPLLAGAALVIAVGLWLPAHRPSPFWGRMADIADTLLIVALFPLALGVAGVFGYVRGLG